MPRRPLKTTEKEKMLDNNLNPSPRVTIDSYRDPPEAKVKQPII